ncbi:MAG: FHA domain-containing protein, partial [Myxococcaceae bacterium]
GHAVLPQVPMSDVTRVVRLRADIDRGQARNGRTNYLDTCELPRVVLVDHHALFNHHQRRLHQLLRDYPKPGVAVFALHHQKGIAGHLWLEATEQLRAGTIGRHSKVDLHLPDDEELSLRHLLVLVRRTAGALHLRIADLATPAGFQAEEGGVLRAVTANGTLVLRAASYSLFVLPTGEPPPWDPAAADPWLTLPQRAVVAEARVARSPLSRRQRARETSVTFVAGPAEPGPGPMRDEGEAVEGMLVITNDDAEQRLSVGASALERGIILGRYSRCSGDTSMMTDAVSRVHAMLIAVEGDAYLVDAGSTNGVFAGKVEVKCAAVEAGCEFSLGGMTVRWEKAR